MRNRCRGFNLAELVVSMLILSVLAVLLMGVVPASINGTREAQHRTVAAMLARQQLEELRLQPFDTLQAGAPVSQSQIDIEHIQYQVLYQVTPSSLPTDPDAVDAAGNHLVIAKNLEVTVRWRYRRRGQSEYKARAVVVRR